MLSKKMLIGFCALGIGIASAGSAYKVEFAQATQVGGTELKAGAYKVEIQGDKAISKSGKDVVAQSSATVENGKDVVAQSSATVENGKQKYSATAVSTKASKLESIAVGGTTMKIVLPQ